MPFKQQRFTYRDSSSRGRGNAGISEGSSLEVYVIHGMAERKMRGSI
jgi:hypothetical protein